MNRFPKSSRLTRPAEFRRTMDKGVKVVCPSVVLFSTPAERDAQAVARLGLVVSRKVGGSVVRNRVKRRLREAWRHLEQTQPALARDLTGRDVVVVARPQAAEQEHDAFNQGFVACLSRLSRQIKSRNAGPAGARP